MSLRNKASSLLWTEQVMNFSRMRQPRRDDFRRPREGGFPWHRLALIHSRLASPASWLGPDTINDDIERATFHHQ